MRRLAPLTMALLATAVHAQPLEGFQNQVTSSTHFDAQALWEDYDSFHRTTGDLWLFEQEDLGEFLDGLLAQEGSPFTREHLIDSAEGRPIERLTFGTGETSVLIWARQHGDEALCSAAMLDFLGYLQDRQDSPTVQAISENLTLHIVPMVNPDGVARLTRRNAMGIDPNRDARLQQTPSGQALRSMWEQFQPVICFNMHDQSARKSTSDNGELIAISLQACPFDEAETLGPQLERAKTISGYMANSLEPWIGGHIARYEADYMPRAFGDSMSRWGVASVLIESGGWFGPKEESEAFVVKCHFMALISGLAAAATQADADVPPDRYDRLPLEGRSHYDLVLRNSLIIGGQGLQPMRGDIAINRTINERQGRALHGAVRDVGDMGVFRGREDHSHDNQVATPALVMLRREITVDRLADPHVTRSLLERGVGTVLGTWMKGDPTIKEPTEFSPIRGVLFEEIESPEVALARGLLTEAYGFRIHCDSVAREDIQPMVPDFELPDGPFSVDVHLVNSGRFVANTALIALGSPTGLTPERLDLSMLAEMYGRWHVAMVVPGEVADLQPVQGQRLHLMGADSPSLNEIVQALPGWEISPLIHTFTEKVFTALALDNIGGLRGGQTADIALWSLLSGDSGAMDEFEMGPIRALVMEGHMIPLE